MSAAKAPIRAKPPVNAPFLGSLGLESQPFAAVADDGFRYSDAALDLIVGRILTQLERDGDLWLLTAESGTGKTTLLQRVLAQAGDTLLICAFQADPQATYADIEHTVREQWASIAGTADSPLPALLRVLCGGNRHPVVIIDDAHDLSRDALVTLLRVRGELGRHCRRLPALILTGEPRLEAFVDECAVAGAPVRPLRHLRVPALTEAQTEAYLHFRLRAAGARNPSLLSGVTARKIHRESGGNPGRINALANLHLQTPAKPSAPVEAARRARSPSHLPTAAVLSLVVGSVAALLYWYVTNTGGVLETRAVPEPTAARVYSPEPPPLPFRQQQPPATFSPALPQLPASETPHSLEDETTDRPAVSDFLEAPSILIEPAADSPLAVPILAPEADTVAQAPVVTTVSPPHSPDPVTESPDPQSAASEPVVNARRDQPSPPAAAPSPPRAAAASPGPGRARLHDSDWVWSRPASHYTIQIAAGSNLQGLRNTANTLPANMPSAWFRSRRNDRDWYALVVGEFPDSASAKAAAANLPASARQNQPWIRNFGAIQATMVRAD